MGKINEKNVFRSSTNDIKYDNLYVYFWCWVELNSNYLQAIAGLMWMSHLIASTERKTVWDATKKKSSYREEFPKKWILQLNIVVCEDINHAHS